MRQLVGPHRGPIPHPPLVKAASQCVDAVEWTRDAGPAERLRVYLWWYYASERAHEEWGRALAWWLALVRGLDKHLRLPDPTTRRVPITVAMRRAVIERDGHRCRYCGGAGDEKLGPNGRAWHMDRIIPVSLDGDSTMANLALACGPCNFGKGARLDAESLFNLLASQA